MMIQLLFVFLSACLGAACSYAGTAAADVTLFGALITRDVIAEEIGLNKPFDFSVNETADKVQHFVAELRFDRRDQAEHYVVEISVASASHFLDPAAYKRRRDTAAQADTPVETDFPSIGQRAQREYFGAGPGGGAYGLTFTTSDGRFDVRVTVSNLMPEGVEEPRFDMDGFAQRLSNRYDEKAKAIGSKAGTTATD